MKLYKRIENDLYYWETWDKDNKTGIVHWGKVGNRGEDKEVKSKLFLSFRKEIQAEINKMVNQGYQEIDLDDHYTLLIEFAVDGMGTDEDLEKRTRLQDRMNETLGWIGLGHCDGGSTGNGTMEVCCYVVDFSLAKAMIEADLTNTEFEDYTRICNENA